MSRPEECSCLLLFMGSESCPRYLIDAITNARARSNPAMSTRYTPCKRHIEHRPLLCYHMGNHLLQGSCVARFEESVWINRFHSLGRVCFLVNQVLHWHIRNHGIFCCLSRGSSRVLQLWHCARRIIGFGN
ncbi:hypothetical protein D3C79_866910 [compost metagenome]